MTKRFTFLFVVAALSLCLTHPALADNTPSEASIATNNVVMKDLDDLVTRINANLQQDKTNETDLADNLKEFDALLEKHKNEKPEDRAQILLRKAELYSQVLDQPQKVLEIFKQIKRDFPNLQVNGDIDDTIKALEKSVEAQKVRRALAPGAAFPDFQEKDITGEPISVSKYKGKVLLVDFWATWCVPCVISLPEVIEAYDKHHKDGFEVIAISLDQQQSAVEKFIKTKKMAWQQFCDTKGWESPLVAKYGVEAIPATYLLDRNGKIIGANLRGDALETAIAKALEKK
jgi:peroxiredoxin